MSTCARTQRGMVTRSPGSLFRLCPPRPPPCPRACIITAVVIYVTVALRLAFNAHSLLDRSRGCVCDAVLAEPHDRLQAVEGVRRVLHGGEPLAPHWWRRRACPYQQLEHHPLARAARAGGTGMCNAESAAAAVPAHCRARATNRACPPGPPWGSAHREIHVAEARVAVRVLGARAAQHRLGLGRWRHRGQHQHRGAKRRAPAHGWSHVVVCGCASTVLVQPRRGPVLKV